MQIKFTKIIFLAFIVLGILPRANSQQQEDPFPHNPMPMQSTVGMPGYIGTTEPTSNKIPGLTGPTGYNAPGQNGNTGPIGIGGGNALSVYPNTGANGPNNKPSGPVGTTDYIVPRQNGTTGVTGLPGSEPSFP